MAAWGLSMFAKASHASSTQTSPQNPPPPSPQQAPSKGRKADYDHSFRANSVLMQSIKPGSTPEEASRAAGGKTMNFEDDVKRIELEKRSLGSPGTVKEKTDSVDEAADQEDDDLLITESDDTLAVVDSKSGRQGAGVSSTSAKTKKKSSSQAIRSMGTVALVPVVFFGVIEVGKSTREAVYVNKAIRIQEQKKREFLEKKQNQDNKWKRPPRNPPPGGDDDDDE